MAFKTFPLSLVFRVCGFLWVYLFGIHLPSQIYKLICLAKYRNLQVFSVFSTFSLCSDWIMLTFLFSSSLILSSITLLFIPFIASFLFLYFQAVKPQYDYLYHLLICSDCFFVETYFSKFVLSIAAITH